MGELAPVGVGEDFQTKREAKLRALEADSGVQEADIARLRDNNRAFCEAKGRLTVPRTEASDPENGPGIGIVWASSCVYVNAGFARLT